VTTESISIQSILELINTNLTGSSPFGIKLIA